MTWWLWLACALGAAIVLPVVFALWLRWVRFTALWMRYPGVRLRYLWHRSGARR